jgi:anti-sigma B factor antagonist
MHSMRVEQEGRTTVVHVEGELDAFAAPDIRATFEFLPRGSPVLADLSRISFLDSTALGLFVKAVRTLTASGAEVRVVLPTTSARRIFQITKLDSALPVCASRSEALAELSLQQH